MLLVIHLVIVAINILLGVLFARGKGASLIAGYNTMPRTEREKVDKKKLCKAMSRLMFILAACWLVVAASEVFHTLILLWVGLALFLVAAIVGAICIKPVGREKT